MSDFDPVVWRKASASSGDSNCVEVARVSGTVGIRDSKDLQGTVLRFTDAEFAAFTAGVRDGDFDR